MDRLTGIRQRTEAGGPVRRIDMKYLLSEVDRLNALHKREIIVTGEYAQRVIDLTARAEKAAAERDTYRAALEAALGKVAYFNRFVERRMNQNEKNSHSQQDSVGRSAQRMAGVYGSRD